MDPDTTLDRLRELYNEFVQDEGFTGRDDLAEVLTMALVMVDDLDNWLMNGGFLPRAWRR